MKHVTIVCDGSSLGNGRGETRAAAVAILEYQGKRKILGEYLGNATNQQAEIIAACIGLEALKEPCQVKLISDSQYVIKTMNGEFKRKTNHEFWQRLDTAKKMHKVTWEWTRGHAGHPIQEICDEAARIIALAGKVEAGGGKWTRAARPRVDKHPTQLKWRWELEHQNGAGEQPPPTTKK